MSARILVVDDIEANVRLLQAKLEAEYYEVLTAPDGPTALAVAAAEKPDIVLLDVMMPGMDGFEVARRLKAHPETAHIPIIFMTGLTETEHVITAFGAGGVDYVTKPIVIEEMLARIRVHLANARLTQSARAALDVSGRFLLAVNRQGKIMWATPQAQKLLSDTLPAGTGEEFELPSAMLQYWQPELTAIHANVKLQYMDQFWIGAGYRFADLVGGYNAMVGVNISNTFNISYSYESSTTSRLRTYTGNTHEIMLGFLLGNKYGESCPRNVW